jgi:cytochrome c oxidase accessory protein FixG
MRLDQAGWSVQKVLRKLGKQLLWISFALYTGYTFVGYFTPVRDLTDSVLAATLGGWELFWILFYGFATYGNAGYMREQVCKYMCPYARFQSAMFDRDSLIISYDTERGEPRGSRARGIDPKEKGLGDCIDCKLCVQACPTGIDIRQGLQLECIACAACIDACDGVMDRMNYPRGLVRYTTQNALDNVPTRVFRPRIIIYGSVLLALIVGFGVAVANRQLVEVDVLRDRNALYRHITNELDGDLIENVYTVRFINKDTREHALRIEANGIAGVTVDTDSELQQVGAGEVVSTAVRIRVPSRSISGGRDIQIVARSDDGTIEAKSKARFIAPVAR